MKNLLLLLSLNFLLVCSAFAQDAPQSPAAAGDEVPVATGSAPALRKVKSEDGAEASRRFWLSLSLTNVVDTNVTHDEQGVRSFGLVPSLGFHFQDDAERPSFEADYEVAIHRYSNTDEYDRTSHNFAASYRRRFMRRWYAKTTAEMSFKGSSEDRDVNNQYIVEQQLQYRPNSTNRLQIFGAYRLKRYPLAETGKNAVDPYVGGKFQQRLRGDVGWEVSYRYDKNRSQDPKDRYVRWTYGAQFFKPLFKSKHDLLTLGARYSPRLYARQVKVDGERVARHDRRWVFDALYERPLGRDVRLGVGYGYETRNSNDPEKKFNSHLFSMTFAYKWWQ